MTERPVQIGTESYNFLLDNIQKVGERPGGLIECYVPIDLVLTEDVAVSEEHVAELAQSMLSEQREEDTGTGQLTPLLLAFVEGEDKLLIIDGFHRAAALKDAGIDRAYATLRSSTREEVIDLRIMTAHTHKAVQFARIVEWIESAWSNTPWADRYKVGQAVALYKNIGSGARSGLSEEEIGSVKNWIERKCGQWQISAATLYNHLSVAAVADPGLIKEARVSKGGRSLEGITLSHLKVIAQGLPYNFAVQRLVADLTKKHNLRIPATRRLVDMLSDVADPQNAQKILATVDFRTLEPVYGKTRTREIQAKEKIEYELSNLHARSGGVLSPIDMATFKIRKTVDDVLKSDALDPATINQLKTARNELERIGRQVLELSAHINRETEKRTLNVGVAANPETVPGDNEYYDLNSSAEDRVAPDLVDGLRPLPANDSVTANTINKFLLGQGDVPVIVNRREVWQAEHAIAHPPVGASYELVEDLREAVREARRLLFAASPPVQT